MANGRELAVQFGRLVTFRPVELAQVPNSPGLFAVLWIATAALYILEYVLIPFDGTYQSSSILLMASAMALAALVGAAFAGRAVDTVRFGVVFMAAAIAAGLAWLALMIVPDTNSTVARAKYAAGSGVLVWLYLVVLAFVGRADTQRLGGASAVFTVLVLVVLTWAAPYSSQLDGYVATKIYSSRNTDTSFDGPPQIDPESLWLAQSGLVSAALAGLRPATGSTQRITVLSVAAGGSQKLFGREAAAARDLLVRRFGAQGRALLLSNAEADLHKVPLASGTNLAAVLNGVAKAYDPRRDLVIVYLTSHGSREAELSTNLPDYSSLRAIGAQSLAKALDEAGIRRRIVVVSACYAGAWIKPLATPETILITAAAADRTSFGCDDSRRYTVFGQAFIEGALANGASLEEAFAQLKREVAREEVRNESTPSLPQSFVGEQMRDIWTQRRQPVLANAD